MKLNFSFVDKFLKIVNKIIKPKKWISRKYSEKEYIKELINLTQSSLYWRRYNGKINGRTLNNKHHQYIKYGVYETFYKYLLNKYFKINKTNKLKYQSIDTSFVPNKYGVNISKRNKYYKNKRGIKISTIVDKYGIPISVFLIGAHRHDCITVNNTLMKLLIKTNTRKYKKHNRFKQYFLADKGYDTKIIRKLLKDNHYIPIIPYNKRNSKNINNKKLKLTKIEKEHYKKRIIVENYFGWLKIYPKMCYFCEKTYKSFKGLIYFISSIILFNRL